MKLAYRLCIDDGGVSALFLSVDAAANEAMAYLLNNPQTIVMVVEVQLATCKHCDLTIVEKPGWMIHKWVHVRTGAYLCWDESHTQAEPLEEDEDDGTLE